MAIVQHRIPSGHDGLQFFTLQYVFLNNAIQGGGIEQWMPYMNHGAVGTLWYGIQGSFLQNVLLYAAPLLRNADLLSLFHLGMFVDEMILLTGTWLVARRFFKAPATFFIAASVVGSCVWLDQPYWNFRLYYALPLVIEMGHRFLDTGRWRWLFLAANLLALQTIGNLPYFIPVASFVVAAYFIFYAAANMPVVWPRIKALRWRGPAVLTIVLSAASFFAAYDVLTIGVDQLVSYNAGRSQMGTTDLAGFLTYGGATGLLKWTEAVVNLSAWYDLTMYAGVLLVPLVIVGAFTAGRRRSHLVLLAVTMLLFTLATPVSALLYHVWPAMKFFRHIGLATPLVKVLLCFVAGIGFEWLFDPTEGRRVWAVRLAVVAGVLVLLAGAGLAMFLATTPDPRPYVDWLSDTGLDHPTHSHARSVILPFLKRSLVTTLSGAALLLIVPLVLAAGWGHRRRSAILGAVLALVMVDLYAFKFDVLRASTYAIPPAARSVTQPAAMTLSVRRYRSLQQAAANPRLRATMQFNVGLSQHLQGRMTDGAKYWTNNAYFFVDEAGSSFRVDSWMKPLDQMMRAYWHLPIDDVSIAPPGIADERFDFPMTTASGAVAGVSADKFRFFEHAYRVTSADRLAPLMTDASYGGNLLFVLPTNDAPGLAPDEWTAQRPLSDDDTRSMSYRLERFDANHVVVRVTNPLPTAAWMSYADVWHPLWRATVNGRDVPVSRAQMAYKAVPIEPGENVVAFTFGSSRLTALAAIFAVNAAIWLGLVVLLMWEIARG